MRRAHDLKTWPEPFDAVRDGRKRFEWRRDDRGYAVGDALLLRKWDPTSRRHHPHGAYVTPLGRFNAWHEEAETLKVRVTYIARGQHGIPEGYVVLGIELEEPDHA